MFCPAELYSGMCLCLHTAFYPSTSQQTATTHPNSKAKSYKLE